MACGDCSLAIRLGNELSRDLDTARTELKDVRAALKKCVLRLTTEKEIIVAECDPDEEDVEEAEEFIEEMRTLSERTVGE